MIRNNARVTTKKPRLGKGSTKPRGATTLIGGPNGIRARGTVLPGRAIRQAPLRLPASVERSGCYPNLVPPFSPMVRS